MSQAAFFHDESGRVRFWVSIDGVDVGASVTREALHYRYSPQTQGEDPLVTFRTNLLRLENAVRRRVASGSIEPVMLRESDLRNAQDGEDGGR